MSCPFYPSSKKDELTDLREAGTGRINHNPFTTTNTLFIILSPFSRNQSDGTVKITPEMLDGVTIRSAETLLNRNIGLRDYTTFETLLHFAQVEGEWRSRCPLLDSSWVNSRIQGMAVRAVHNYGSHRVM